MIPFNSFLYEEDLTEGVYDPGILKGFFTAGGPGSGKTWVTGQAGLGRLSPLGVKIVNSDAQYEKLLADANLAMTPQNIFSPRGQKIRKRAKEMTKAMKANYTDGRLGLLIDGTGKDFEKIQTTSNALRKIGYDTYMIFINTSLDVALTRNLKRPRKLPEKDVTKMWNAVQQNIGKFQIHFGRKNILILDNNDENDNLIEGLFVRVKKLVDEPVINTIGKQWIASELKKKKRK
jgi:predicted kinase